MVSPVSVRVLVHQGGPVGGPVSTDALGRVDAALAEEPADLVLLSELSLSPYFATASRIHLDSALTLDGPEVGAALEIARARGVHLILPLALRGPRGTASNACVLAGPDGLVEGRMVSGPRAGRRQHQYAKVHLSENNSSSPGVHEKFQFTPGDGFLLWETPLGRIAPLICYDRSFPEAWRTVADAGAEVVVVPIATSRPERVRMLEAELSVGAVQNGVFVLAACKAGTETVDGSAVTYSGGTMAVGPDGTIIARAPSADPDLFVRATLERDALERYPQTFHYARDRQPLAYRRIEGQTAQEDVEATDG